MQKIDPEVPFNKLLKMPPGVGLEDPEILIATIDAGEAIAKLSTQLSMGREQTLANALHLLSPLFVPEAVSSSGIENIVTTNESIYIAKIMEERELRPTEKEALNYLGAINHGIQRLLSREILVTNDLIAMQKILEPMNSGLRKMPGTHLSNPLTKKIVYTPPEGEKLIRDLLENFDQYFNEDSPTHEVLARMAILHYQFEAIHPFHDGNGRTGRMLMPLYLMKQGRLPLPILFISKYILEHREEYYKKLRAVTYQNKWKEWILYILTATKVQAEYTCEILKRIDRVANTVRTTVKEKLPHAYSTELIEFLFSHVYFTQKELEIALGVHTLTARKYLRELEENKIVSKKKQPRRNRYIYITPPYIAILRKA